MFLLSTCSYRIIFQTFPLSNCYLLLLKNLQPLFHIQLVAQGYKIFKRLKELRLEKKAKMKELNCLYALTDYIDCESLADTCEDNLAEIEDIMEVPEHSEVTKMQPVDNGQEENMHIVEDMVG